MSGLVVGAREARDMIRLPRASTVVVCLVMLLIGLVLYFVNDLAKRRLDPQRPTSSSERR